jgi:hypothetical protein
MFIQYLNTIVINCYGIYTTIDKIDLFTKHDIMCHFDHSLLLVSFERWQFYYLVEFIQLVKTCWHTEHLTLKSDYMEWVHVKQLLFVTKLKAFLFVRVLSIFKSITRRRRMFAFSLLTKLDIVVSFWP